MAELLIQPEQKQWIPLPHYLLINGQMVGMMRGKGAVHVLLADGNYDVTIRSAYKWIESTVQLKIRKDETICLTFGDREKLWNWLFNLDLILWCIKRFIHIGEPWSTIYEVVSNGFFAVWLLRIWIIRKHYFKLTIREQVGPKT